MLDLTDAKNEQHRKPNNHHRTEEYAHLLRTKPLEEKQDRDDDDDDRHSLNMFKPFYSTQSFDGRCDRNRRSDNTIRQKCSGPQDRRNDKPFSISSYQSIQRKNSTFS